ncbi:hypothetical protein ALC60_07882 [Trachymyrmex zeteki]|uniref:Uncharacterized protein n=1 Tax=Mycetomoellerius zeteki TaxID=64791 RepID=A0A151WZ34_9HYME|nr:hypothetical protein ALC60_07882 [Trachymyrmex zeteki]
MHLRVFMRARPNPLSENANCESYESLGGAVTRQGIKAKSSFSDLCYEAFAITLEYLDSYKSLVTHVGFGGTPSAAANAIMHVNVRVFSLLPSAVRSKTRRTARTNRLYFTSSPKIIFYWSIIKYTHHSFEVVKRRLTVHNGYYINIKTHISLCDKGDHSNYCVEVTFSFDLL